MKIYDFRNSEEIEVLPEWGIKGKQLHHGRPSYIELENGVWLGVVGDGDLHDEKENHWSEGYVKIDEDEFEYSNLYFNVSECRFKTKPTQGENK